MRKGAEKVAMLQNNDHPFLRPLWRRVALVALCAAWTVFELVNGETMWVTLAGGMTALGAWQYLIAYKPPPDKAGDKEP